MKSFSRLARTKKGDPLPLGVWRSFVLAQRRASPEIDEDQKPEDDDGELLTDDDDDDDQVDEEEE